MIGPSLELVDVTAGYGSIVVLQRVSLAVQRGEILALLGPNGGGKSTTISVCSGLVPITSGELRLAGRSITGAAPDALARAGVCTVPEGRGIFPNLSVRENLMMASHTGIPLTEIEAAAYRRVPTLGQRPSQLAGTMSGGQQQMLSMSRALATNPAVLLLDELSMGLAPIVVSELYNIVAAVAAEGVSVLLVEQFARSVLGIAHRAAIMVNGRIIRTGAPDEIAEELTSAYLGGKARS
jgi:branched-chain amino acid transport system ATP-binding protein